jgi:hypothetical protein
MFVPTRGRLIAAAVAGLISLLGAGGFGAMKLFKPKADLDKIRELQSQLYSEEGRKLPEEQRNELRAQYEQERAKLTEEQRNELRVEQMNAFEARMDRFFSLTRAEQIEHLDAEIDRWDAMRKRWEEERAARAAAQAAQGGSATEGEDSNSGQSRQRTGGSDSGRSFFSWFDSMTPQARAKFDEYRRQIDDRRRERGLPPISRTRRPR